MQKSSKKDNLLRLIKDKTSIVYLFILIIILAWTVIERPYKNSPPIRSDGIGYHIWSYGIKNWDFTYCNYLELLGTSVSVINSSEDRCGVKYPPGVGAFQLPFTYFFMDSDATQGFTTTEHSMILWLGALLLVLSTIFLNLSLIHLKVKDLNRTISIALITFGTGLFHYSTYDASFSHIYSVFGCSALLLLAIKHQKASWSLLSLIGFIALSYWLYTVRQTNGAITIAIALYAFSNANIKDKILITLSWSAATALAILTQVFYNYYVTGELHISSYGQENFPGIGRYFSETFFSYERGLFTYYPIYLISLLLGLIYFRSKLFLIFTGLTLVFALVYSSWHSWYLGAGMGHRGFIELTPFAVLVLASSLENISKKKILLSTPIFMVCSYVTVSVMINYWSGHFPFSGATKEIYNTVVKAPLSSADPYKAETFSNISLELSEIEKSDNKTRISIKITNNSAEAINSNSVKPPVRISWLFMDNMNKEITSWDPRVDLNKGIPSKESIVQTIVIPNSDIPTNSVSIQISLVQEGIFWGHDVGMSLLRIRLSEGNN